MKLLFVLHLGLISLALAETKPPSKPLTPIEVYTSVHKRIVKEFENYKRDGKIQYNYMATFLKDTSARTEEEKKQAALKAFEPFTKIADEAAIELKSRNGMDTATALAIAQRAVAYDPLIGQACSAGQYNRTQEPPPPPAKEDFKKSFGKDYQQGDEFTAKTRPQPVDTTGQETPEQIASRRLGLPPSRQLCAISSGNLELLEDTTREKERIQDVNEQYALKLEGRVQAAENDIAEVKKATVPIERPAPTQSGSSPRPEFPLPNISENGVVPDPKSATDPRSEIAEENVPATHRGSGNGASHPVDGPTNHPLKGDRLASETVDAIIRQTLNDKLLTRDMDRRTADVLAEQLTSAYKNTGDLNAAFSSVQKSLSEGDLGSHPDEKEGLSQLVDGNSRVTPFSGTPDEALLKEFVGESLKTDNEKSSALVIGIGPAAGLISSLGTGALSSDDFASKTLSALNAKNALNWTVEEKATGTSSFGMGGGTLADGKATGYGTDFGSTSSGTNATLVNGAKLDRPVLQIVRGKLRSFLDSISKTFKPRSLSGGALRGLASTGSAGVEDSTHLAADETALALASFGEVAGDEWAGSAPPNIWISIGFFLAAFGATLGGFIAWQNWRLRKSEKEGRTRAR